MAENCPFWRLLLVMQARNDDDNDDNSWNLYYSTAHNVVEQEG